MIGDKLSGYITLGLFWLLVFVGFVSFADPNIRARYYAWAEKVSASCQYRAEPQGDGTYKLYRC